MIWSSKVTAKMISVIYLTEVLMLAPLTSSFVLPTGSRIGGVERGIIRGSCSYSWRRSATTEPEAVEPVVDFDEDKGSRDEVKTPAGLTLEGVYKRLYVEVQGLDDGVVGLESKDTDYGVSQVVALAVFSDGPSFEEFRSDDVSGSTALGVVTKWNFDW